MNAPCQPPSDERKHGQSPRIKGHERYDNGVAWIVNRLRRNEMARFEYHHYTAFHITIQYAGTAYQMSVGVGSRRPLTGYVMPGHSEPRALAREFALLDDDAASIQRLLTDLGREISVFVAAPPSVIPRLACCGIRWEHGALTSARPCHGCPLP